MPRKETGREKPRFDGTLAAGGCYGLPLVRTLSEEYRDVPEPQDSDKVPPPEPPGLVGRIEANLHKPRTDKANR